MTWHWDDMARVGQIARPHGLRGQVIVNPDTDFAEERYRAGGRLFIGDAAGVRALHIESCRFQQGRPVVGFEGVADMDAAEALAGIELRIPREWLTPLPAGTYYRHDLIGCDVETADGRVLGRVVDLEGSGAESRLVVSQQTDAVLIPLVDAICPTIDPVGRRIVVTPPDGLLELNVPASRQARATPGTSV